MKERVPMPKSEVIMIGIAVLLVIFSVFGMYWGFVVRDGRILTEAERHATIRRTHARNLLNSLLNAKSRKEMDLLLGFMDPADKKIIEEIQVVFERHRAAKQFEVLEKEGLVTKAEFTDEFKESFRKLIVSQRNGTSNTKDTTGPGSPTE